MPVRRQRPQEQSGEALRQSKQGWSLCSTGNHPDAVMWASIQGGLLQAPGVGARLAHTVPVRDW